MGSLKGLTIEGARCPAHLTRRRLITACGLARPHVGEPHHQLQSYRVHHHDAFVLWLFDHIATRRRTTVSYEQKTKAQSERAMPIIIGADGALHEKPAERLRSMGVSLAELMAFAMPSVEYQHHRLRWPAWCGRTPRPGLLTCPYTCDTGT